MKKLFLMGALALAGLVSAQEYKPVSGDVTVDFGLTGGLGNTSVSIPDQGFVGGSMFKARYFKTNDLAYRMSLVVNSNFQKADADNKASATSIGVGAGIEKHFTGTERLSPYVGGDFLVNFTSKTQKAVNTEVTGPNGFGIGINGVFGADYYIAKRVYLGVEAGLGLMYANDGKTTTKTKGSPDKTVKGGSQFSVKPNIVSGIRLGYAF